MRILSFNLILLFILLFNISGYCQYSDSKTLYLNKKILLQAIIPDSIFSEIDHYIIKKANISVTDSFVTGKNVGTDSLYLFSSSDKKIAQIYFTILPYIPINSVKIIPDSVSCYINDTLQLAFSALPLSASITYYTWHINSSIATIDNKGRLKALSEGNTLATIKIYPSLDTFSVKVQIKTCKPPVVTDSLHICNNDTLLLLSNNNKTEWYSDQALKTSKGLGNFFSPQYFIGRNTYYAIIRDGSCVSTAVKSELIVHNIPSAPDFTSKDSLYNIDSLSKINFNKKYSWYESLYDILSVYTGFGLPPNLLEGQYSYWIKQGDTCESSASKFTFRVYKLYSDSLLISGKITGVDNTFKGVIQFLSTPSLSIALQYMCNGNTFMFKSINKGDYVFKLTPLNIANHLPVYLGNTTNIEKAHILNLSTYNIGGLDIDMSVTTSTDIEQKKVFVYKSNNKLVVNISEDEEFRYKIFNIIGQLILEGNIHQGTNIIETNTLNGLYVFSMENYMQLFLLP